MQGCRVGVGSRESGFRSFLGQGSRSRESRNFALKCATPDSLEMSHFYVKNLRKCKILEKYLAKTFFYTIFLVNYLELTNCMQFLGDGR